MAFRACRVSSRRPMLRRVAQRTSTKRGRRSTESIAFEDALHFALDGLRFGVGVLGFRWRRWFDGRRLEPVFISAELHPNFRLFGRSVGADVEGRRYHEQQTIGSGTDVVAIVVGKPTTGDPVFRCARETEEIPVDVRTAVETDPATNDGRSRYLHGRWHLLG